MEQQIRDEIKSILIKSIENNEFVKATLGKPASSSGSLRNIIIRPVMVRDAIILSATYRYETKDETKNFGTDDTISLINELIGNSFLSLHIFTIVADYQLVLNKRRKGEIKTAKPTFTEAIPLFHDVKTSRLISAEGNPYLFKLGVTNKEGKVLHPMGDKYRQINKFVEILTDLITKINPADIGQIYDMGCGKGYLTFALYDNLVNHLKLPVSITGVEIRQELVTLCKQIAGDIGFEKLRFVQGDINEVEINPGSSLIALHACDTATDEAIYKGIKAGSPLIVCAPCCQKQVRKDMKPPEKWNPIFRNGILFERQAEILTDVLRSLIMQKHGYDTSIFEFISPEHTAKNLMIAGVKGKTANSEQIDRQIMDIKNEFGVTRHYLEELLGK